MSEYEPFGPSIAPPTLIMATTTYTGLMGHNRVFYEMINNISNKKVMIISTDFNANKDDCGTYFLKNGYNSKKKIKKYC